MCKGLDSVPYTTHTNKSINIYTNIDGDILFHHPKVTNYSIQCTGIWDIRKKIAWGSSI
jgi:hypothetical protein